MAITLPCLTPCPAPTAPRNFSQPRGTGYGPLASTRCEVALRRPGSAPGRMLQQQPHCVNHAPTHGTHPGTSPSFSTDDGPHPAAITDDDGSIINVRVCRS